MADHILGSYFCDSDIGLTGDKCTICLHALNELEHDEYIGKVASCGHNFCFTCISTWCESSSTCCACRAPVDEILKIQRMSVSEALQFQARRRADISKRPRLRSSELFESRMVPVPTTASTSTDSVSTISVSLLVGISIVARQVQRAPIDGDQQLALQVHLEEEALASASASNQVAEDIGRDDDIGRLDALPTDVCNACKDGGLLILCDGCNSLWHLGCVHLQEIPEGLWICASCELQRADLSVPRAEFIRLHQVKLASLAAAQAAAQASVQLLDTKEDEDEEDDGPVFAGPGSNRRQRQSSSSASSSDSSSSSSSSSPGRKRPLKAAKGDSRLSSWRRRMNGYREDGFVVPEDSESE